MGDDEEAKVQVLGINETIAKILDEPREKAIERLSLMVSGSLQALHQEVGKLSQELEHLKRSATVYLGLLHVLMKDRHVTDANITVASVNQVFAEEKLVIDWREEWQKWRLRRVPKIDGPRIHRPPPGFKA